MKIKIENSYSGGHKSTTVIEVAIEPDSGDAKEIEYFWDEEVFPETGDGHGGYATYTATITEADDAALVGLEYVWEG